MTRNNGNSGPLLDTLPAAPGPAAVPLATMRGITKAFSHVPVLESVDFDVTAGEVHVLAGENGAGKSTLMKILSGAYSDFDGDIILRGHRVRFRSAAEARRRGIAMIHQEMSLIPAMSVAGNVFLGREHAPWLGWVDDRSQIRAARELLARLGLQIDPGQPVESLPVSARQMIEIAKALAGDSSVLIMDEPTSALNQPEVERLFGIIRTLTSRGCGIVYITHKMEEIYRIADRITVLRDGRRVGTATREALAPVELVRWMVGRDLNQQFPARSVVRGETRLLVEGLTVAAPGGAPRRLVDGVSLSVRAGEIVGLGGLEGAGNHELLRALFGAYGPCPGGRVMLDGRTFTVASPAHSLACGVALLTSDRKTDGLVQEMSVAHNTTLAALPRFSPYGWLRPAREEQAAAGYRLAFDIRLASLRQPVAELSGGNQQKVLLARWIEAGARVLLLDEPTRGVDVGAKQEIYRLMNQWTAQGIAILLITSEMPELLAMSDRILVMHRGRVTAEFGRRDATQESVLHAAMGREAS